MLKTVSIKDLGVTAGYGLFETLRVYDGEPFLVEEHVERLLNSTRELSFPGIGEKETLIKSIYRYVEQTGRPSLAIRISVTFGNEAEAAAPAIFFSNREIPYRPREYEEGIVAAFSPYRKNEYSPLAFHKTFNQMENILSLKQSQEKNKKVKECIFLNTSGYLAEGSKSNLFFGRGGVVYTPAVECGLLPGITRRRVMELLRRQGIEVMEGKYRSEELYESDEVFCTNSLMEVMPVVKVDEKVIGNGLPGALTQRALFLYRER